jgi:hypothetical protein
VSQKKNDNCDNKKARSNIPGNVGGNASGFHDASPSDGRRYFD